MDNSTKKRFELEIMQVLMQVQNLELENQIIREKIAPLIYENEALRTTIKGQERLRNQVKTLLHSLDDIALTHINKLNEHKQTGVSNQQQLNEKSSATDIIQEIKIDDIKNFYNKPGGIAVKERKMYVFVLGCYSLAKKKIRYVLVLIWRAVKALKRVVR